MMSLHSFSEWLAATSASNHIRETAWIVPAVQSVHILAICVTFASVLLLDLRLLGVLGRSEPVSAYIRRYIPWTVIALLVLMFSGIILIVGEPDRTVENWVFWTKMTLLGSGLALTALFIAPFLRDRTYWDLDRRRVAAMAFAIVSLIIWSTIVVCGRWIAYVI